MDEHDWHDDTSGWHYEPPHLDADGEPLTLALLEDLSKVLVIHGYPPLRGYALSQLTSVLAHLQHDR